MSTYYNSTRFIWSMKNILIIGSGIVGICTGIELIRRGYSVTLMDPNQPGS